MPNQNFFANLYKKSSGSSIDKPIFEKLPKADNDISKNEDKPQSSGGIVRPEERNIQKFVFKKIEDVAAAEQKKEKDTRPSHYDSLGVLSKKKLAAMLLICTDNDKAAKIVSSFNIDELVKISEEILAIDYVTQDDLAQVEKNFGPQNVKDLSSLKGGKEFLRQLLLKAFGVAKGSELFMTVLEKTDDKSFSFLENVSPENIIKIINDESSLIISFVISKLQPSVAAKVLSKLPKEKAAETVRYMSSKTEINSDVLDIIAKKIKEKTKQIIKKDDSIIIDGKDKLIDILKHSDASNMNDLLDSLESDSPDLAQELRDNIFTFNDIVTLKKKFLEISLKDYSNENIAFMLKGTSDTVQNVIFSAMSKRRAEEIIEQMKMLGSVKKTDVIIKQQEFVNYLKDLDAAGLICIRYDEDEFVD